MSAPQPVPELSVREWLNVERDPSLNSLRGKVILIKVFQMLCPGCVSHALPQAQRVAQIFSSDKVAVLGLHSVFEHHEAQGSREALAAFLYEYKISFPVGIDAHNNGDRLPITMATYGMKGTPTTLLIDRDGNLRKHQFGLVDDIILGAEIAHLMKNGGGQKDIDSSGSSEGCDTSGCVISE